MDEIAAVKLFRSAIPERDAVAREAVRASLEAVMRATARRRRPLWRSRRVLLVAVAASVTAVAASSALGWTSQLVDLIAGEPAPPRVKRAFAVQNEARARQVIPIFRTSGASDAIVERTRGIIGIHSSVGPVIIWAAPTKGGGLCWVLDIERLRRSDGRPNGGASCSPHSQSLRAPLEGGIRKIRVGGRYLELIDGRARADVASVELRYADGGTETLPVFERFFLHEPRADSDPTLLVARNRTGDELQRQAIRRRPESLRDRLPDVVGPERLLIRLDTAAGFPLTFALAPAEDDQLCEITRYRGSVTLGCGPDQRERVAGDEISIRPGLWNEAGDGKPLLTLKGVVGVNIARLELQYADGTIAPLPITERFVVFEIPPPHHEDERFVLVGHNSADQPIVRRVIK